MPDRTQAVHLTKQIRHSCLIVMCLPKKTIMSSTAGTVAHVFLSNDVVQSRLSTHVRMYRNR